MWNPFRRSKPKPGAPPVTYIPAHIIDLTVHLLRESGTEEEAHEGIVYWAGRRAANETFVMTCLAPAAATTYGSFRTSSEANACVVVALSAAGLELLGQVHSHPGSSVGHSHGDDENALMPYEGFLSVVVPDYARQGMTPLQICGVHLFEGSKFRRLGKSEVAARFRVVETLVDLRRHAHA
jgi:proteasome lid subunit RPN8/RPN11